MICCLRFDKEWQGIRFVGCDFLVSGRGMIRKMIRCLRFGGIYMRHGKMYDLLLVIYWYLREVW